MAVMDTLVARRGRARPFHWLAVHRCTQCGQWWLVAEDYEFDDYYLRRIDPATAAAIVDHDRWPTDLETRASMNTAHERGRPVPARMATRAGTERS